MVLASRIGANPKNVMWTGDAASDVRMMYTRIVFKLTNDLLDDTPGNPRSRINSLQWSLADTQRMLRWMLAGRIQDEVEAVADAYNVQRSPAVTLDKQEWAVRRRRMTYRRLMRTGAS